MNESISLGNVLTIILIIVGIIIQIIVNVAAMSKFRGIVETELKNLKERLTEISGLCTTCYLKPKVEVIERVQIERTIDIEKIKIKLEID